MSGVRLRSPLGEVRVHPGPMLLRSVGSCPELAVHLEHHGPLPEPSFADLLTMMEAGAVRGRGGAGFPLARKLRAAAEGRRPVVVVNAAEGEPGSAKDQALLETAPHLVLDGAVIVARALGAREIHVVSPGDRPDAANSIARAVGERRERQLRWRRHETPARFVAGQARAVLELLAGRDARPVTAWEPEAVRGHRGRPTLLSNAETFAHVAALVRVGPMAYAAQGTQAEPGTTLLTIGAVGQGGASRASARVVEVGHGQWFGDVLDAAELAGPVLVGGYHGTWVPGRVLATLPVSAVALRSRDLTLGAGVVLPLGAGGCPVRRTAQVVDVLAQESAGRCGPCRNGLPALAVAVHALEAGLDARARVEQLAALVSGRGACAHPDGTARLVRSLLVQLDGLVDDHVHRRCSCSVASEVGVVATAPGLG